MRNVVACRIVLRQGTTSVVPIGDLFWIFEAGFSPRHITAGGVA